MDSTGCPFWIDPGNAFRLDVKVSKYVAEGEYGLAEIDEQVHEIWLDRSVQYSTEKFRDDMATKIIWGPAQTLDIWVVDADSESKWKVRTDEHFEQLLNERWNDRFAVLTVDVMNKYNQTGYGSSGVTCASGVTSAQGSAAGANAEGGAAAAGANAEGSAAGANAEGGAAAAGANAEGSAAGANAEGGAAGANAQGSGAGANAQGSAAVNAWSEEVGDTCSSPPPSVPFEAAQEVDWAELTILVEGDEDGDAKAAVDEDMVYEAMGFQVADERAEEAARKSVPIPTMTAEMTEQMADAAVPVDDNADEEPLYDWDRDNPDLSVGICYPSMPDFRLAVRQYAVLHEFELETAHSDRSRFRGNCAARGCEWMIRARIQHDGTVRIQVHEEKHTCASTSRVVGRMASQAWVAERAIPLLKRKPSMGPRELQKELEYKYNIEIAYQTVVYGRMRAGNKLFGKWDDSFDWLYRFKAEVEMRSPGSIVEIDTEDIEGKTHFTRFFCCFKAAIDGFRNGCRPYISIDSTALNDQWNGHMPAAQALDGHNWMFPLAFGFFQSETKENWEWFMQQLSQAIGPMDNLAVCTDACKGLEAAVAKIWPLAEKRECFRHLMENLKKYYTGEVYGKNMWPAARAYSTYKFNYFFNKVVAASPSILDWLRKDHSLLWARSKFGTESKCDYINNNLAESWNSWIKEMKDLPVHCLADAIREKTMVMFAKRRSISRALGLGILPAVIHQLNAASRGLGHLKVTKGHPDEAEVTERYKGEEVRRHVVYLSQHICSCREWQVTGKPCPHALAVITTRRQPQMEQYVSKYYSVQKLQAAYHGIIPNITDRDQWPEVDKGFKLLPPVSKKEKGPGRQKKNRFLSATERTGKRTRQVQCHCCKEFGHRSGSWRCALTGTKKRKRTKKTTPKTGRKKAKKDNTPPEQETPRTRAAVAREVARQAEAAAAKAAAEAEAAAKVAAEAAAYAEPEPLETEPPSSPRTPPRNTCLELQIVNQLDEVPAPTAAAPKKCTPMRKQLATKIRKTPTKAPPKKSPAKKKRKR